jgi:hypothetical protein
MANIDIFMASMDRPADASGSPGGGGSGTVVASREAEEFLPENPT